MSIVTQPEGATMSNPTHDVRPAIEEIPNEILDLMTMTAELPADFRTRMSPLLARVVESTKRRRRILSLVQDALGQLRLDMKYLVFDLEATRRERDTYRRQLEGAE
jgi:hypothetical protein